jgi:hypothetical protein
MASTDEVFISYSHDSADHVTRVLDLSNRLRREGVNCVLDQYETSPPEGWPRWMDRNIRSAQFVLMVCTEPYFKRVMGEETEGKGLGVRWEGTLIYQHLYNAGTINQRFIPVLFEPSDIQFIPTPLQGASHYRLDTAAGYEDLYGRLTDQPRATRPELGKRRPLDRKEVKTNPIMYLSSPIDVELWNRAQWSATFFAHQPGRPPCLGFAYRDRDAGRRIFEDWHQRYGSNDEYEEIRISIIEGPIKGEANGYTVHVTVDYEAAIRRFRDAGYSFDDDLFMSISRMNRMVPPPDSKNLSMFKTLFREFKTYYLVPGLVSADGKSLEPFLDLGIHKSKVLFRHSSEIEEHDVDAVVLDTGSVKRPRHEW